MAKVKHAAASQLARTGVHARKRRNKISGRAGIIRETQKAPAVIANSAFALTLKPKTWACLSEELASDQDPLQIGMYKDMVSAYNHGAELVGAVKIPFKKNDATTAGIAGVLALFNKNVCPKGFDVNIDEHYNKKTKKKHFHFSVYKTCDFPAYWHFFEIKHVVNVLSKTNPKLHDLFIVFLRSFIHYSSIPCWFDGPMVNAEFTLSSYVEELRDVIKKESEQEVQNVCERTGYTMDQMRKRLSDIEKSMKEYSTGQAQEYMQLLIKTKPLKPHYILRSLKKFPGQNKVVRFMKSGCELMKEKVGVQDFSYDYADGYDSEGLSFSEQVSIIWDWSDHISATQGRNIVETANSLGVFSPTLCARFMPTGTFDLDMDRLTKSLEWPKKLSALQVLFQEITERFTDYNEQRDLL